MDLPEFLTHVKTWTNPTLDCLGRTELEYTTDITPRHYLEFAVADLAQTDIRGRVNAISNAKRAIDCQITSIFAALRVPAARSFPARLESFARLGLLAPRILVKTVKLRNVLEHEFHKPSTNEAEDAVDIATLFVEATKQIFLTGLDCTLFVVDYDKRQSSSVQYDYDHPELAYPDSIYLNFDLEQKSFHLLGAIENRRVWQSDVTLRTPLYMDLLVFLLKHGIFSEHHDRTQSAKEFITLLESCKP